MLFVILKFAKPNIKIANMDSSNPPSGKEAKKAVPIPKIGRIPIAHAGHPGAKMPRNIPVVPKKPMVFPDAFLIMFALYKIKLVNNPKKTVITIRLIKELKNILSLKSRTKVEKSFAKPKKPKSL